MTCSPARLEANRKNAARSTGPRTPEGKERSRANALKHGMTGDGLALPNEDAAEVSRRFMALDAELAPGCEMARILVRRIALMSVRMERSALQEAANLSERVRHAEADFDDQIARQVELLADNLSREPETSARRLRLSVAGIDWLLKRWDDLRYDLNDPDRHRWGRDHMQLAENMSGRRYGYLRVSRLMALSEAVQGRFHALDESDGGDLDGEARREWARQELDALIDREMAVLRETRAAIDPWLLARDRAEAADRAMFDDSRGAVLARRYEAAAERGMFRALRELKQYEAAATEAEVAYEDPEEVSPASPVGSFRPAVAPPDLPDEDRMPAPIAAVLSPAPLGSFGAWDESRLVRDIALGANAYEGVIGRPTSPLLVADPTTSLTREFPEADQRRNIFKDPEC